MLTHNMLIPGMTSGSPVTSSPSTSTESPTPFSGVLHSASQYKQTNTTEADLPELLDQPVLTESVDLGEDIAAIHNPSAQQVELTDSVLTDQQSISLNQAVDPVPVSDPLLQNTINDQNPDNALTAEPQVPGLTPLSASIINSINYMKEVKTQQVPVQTPLTTSQQAIFNQAIQEQELPLRVTKNDVLMNAGAPSVNDLDGNAQKEIRQAVQHLTPADKGAKPDNTEALIRNQRSNASLSIQSISPDNSISIQGNDGVRPIVSTAPQSITATQAQISAPVNTEQWNKQLGDQLIRMTRSGQQQMDIRLNPVELGPMSVSLKVIDGTQAQVQFVSQHLAVRQALEIALPQLREALSEQGISLGQTDVSDKQSEQFAGNQKQVNQNWSSDKISDDISAEVAQGGQVSMPAHDGLVSTYA